VRINSYTHRVRWRRFVLLGALVLAGAVCVAVAYRGGLSADATRDRGDPASDPRCVYANTIFGWVFRASEDSESAGLLTAARGDTAQPAPAEWVTLDVFEHHALIWHAIAEATADLTPPKGFERRHERLTALIKTIATTAADANRTAASGDIEGALTLLRHEQEATAREAAQISAAGSPRTPSLSACFSWSR
jgi:hypothetical protein